MRFSVLALLLQAACAGSQTSDKPKSVEDLGIATPAHPINNPARLELPPGAPLEMPVPNTAVPRATDAGANDETGPLEPEE